MGFSSSSWLYIQSGARQDIAFHLHPGPSPPPRLSKSPVLRWMRTAAGYSPTTSPQPARPAARLTRATKCVTLRVTGIARRYNGYRPVELLRVRRRIPH
jgi:hypothetical protein